MSSAEIRRSWRQRTKMALSFMRLIGNERERWGSESESGSERPHTLTARGERVER